MPRRKRKGAAASKAAGGKKAKKAVSPPPEEEEGEDAAGPSTVSDAIKKLKAADKGKKRTAKPDALCPIQAQSTIHLDYDCMLNQTNINANNNKYYIIQVLRHNNGTYYSWNRWGRVGESGANSLNAHSSVDDAIKGFCKKFRDKTKNKWEDRASFTPAAGKYTLLEMDADEGDEDEEETQKQIAKLDELDGIKRVQAKCTLNKPTQDLIRLIFDNDMFNDAMKDLEIDVKKMPLGKLSKTQIAKGFEALEEIEEAIKANKGYALNELTSRFYTLIPHDFGRARPPILVTEEQVRKKMDMLMILADIEMAQALQKTKTPSMTKESKEVPHPFDINYERLQSDLDLVNKKSKEFKIIDKYVSQTCNSYRKPQILDVWEVNRHDEDKRFLAHDKLDNRRLLWHGTNVAVVAAILKSGLRIMPHSGGRVGKGIYFASENSKSAGYVSCASGGIGIMFLNEVVLGKESHIMRDDWTLTEPPKGYDCIIAKGRTEPDPKSETSITLDGKKVVVPQGKAIPQPAFSTSNFSQSEYLVYKESQNRIRYMLKLKL